MALRGCRRRRAKALGKKVVYATPYRNLAVEMMRMYRQKGENAVVEAERGEGGGTMFLVCIYP
jgi:hypothetical protein